MNTIKLPVGNFSGSDDALKTKREELRKRLLGGQPISVGQSGEVGTNPKIGDKVIPKGTLADAIDDALRGQRSAIPQGEVESEEEKRRKLKEALIRGQAIPLKRGGSVAGGNDKDAALHIAPGKLANLLQWYERDPVLLEAEKAAMSRDFPQFSLIKLSDDRLAWVGDVKLNVMGDNSWRLMAVYQPNHPEQRMGSSVYVYLVEPSIEALIGQLGWRPHHLLRDSNNRDYLCTTEAGYVKASKSQSTSASTVLRWAIKWLLCFELVLTGDMTTEEFDKPHGI